MDRAFVKLYEDRAAERITEYNFNMLSQKEIEIIFRFVGKID